MKYWLITPGWVTFTDLGCTFCTPGSTIFMQLDSSRADVGNGLNLRLPTSTDIGTGVLSVALRPEKISLSPPGDAARATAEACAQGVIESTNFLGGAVLYRIALESRHHVLAQQPNAGAVRLFAPGSTVMLDWKPSDLVVLKD